MPGKFSAKDIVIGIIYEVKKSDDFPTGYRVSLLGTQ